MIQSTNRIIVRDYFSVLYFLLEESLAYMPCPNYFTISLLLSTCVLYMCIINGIYYIPTLVDVDFDHFDGRI